MNEQINRYTYPAIYALKFLLHKTIQTRRDEHKIIKAQIINNTDQNMSTYPTLNRNEISAKQTKKT